MSFYLNGEVIPKIHYEKGNLREAILSQLEDLGVGKNRSLLLPRKGRIFVESYHGSRLEGVHLEISRNISEKLSRNLRLRIRSEENSLESSEEDFKSSKKADQRVVSHLNRARPTLLAKKCDLEISSNLKSVQ